MSRRKRGHQLTHAPGIPAIRREQRENSAPPAAGTQPLETQAEAMRFQRQQKYNPLPFLRPEMLVRVLDAFEHGNIREAVLLWEKIAERDDVLMSVKSKREKAVSQLDRQIVKLDDSPEADAHEEVLTAFWSSVSCYNSYDRNERGGFRRLVKQMMTAASFRYAAHHIIWQPQPDGSLRATFEFVPLWQFENRTGRLRYLPSLAALNGEVLVDGEWMVTVGDGLMIACSIGYLAKRSSFNDWLVFSEKFSVPGVLGRTSARKGTPEGEAMRVATESFGHDWSAVVYGDDGSQPEPIKLVQAQGNPSGMPMPAVVERVDRKFAALYRGADLSTMSANHSAATGASLQQKETEILMRDDAEMIAETLEEVSRQVIEWYFGNGTMPRARVELVVPVSEDASKVVQNGLALAAAGAAVSKQALLDRAGLPAPKDDADRLGTAHVAGPGQDARAAQENAVAPAGDARPEWLDILAADMRPLGEALAAAANAGDAVAVQAALRKLSKDLPDFMETPGLEEYLAGEFARALVGAGNEEVGNGAPTGHEFYGNQYGRERKTRIRGRDFLGSAPGPGMTPAEAEERLENALALAMRQHKSIHQAAWRKELGMIDLPWGTPGDRSNDFKGGHGLSHVIAKHGERDARRLPWIISRGTVSQSRYSDEKREVSLDGFVAVFVQDKPSRSWLLTGFSK